MKSPSPIEGGQSVIQEELKKDKVEALVKVDKCPKEKRALQTLMEDYEDKDTDMAIQNKAAGPSGTKVV